MLIALYNLLKADMIPIRAGSHHRNGGKYMESNELWESTEEELRNAVNVLQLLMAELSANCDDPHIIRSVGIAEGMLQTALGNLQRLKAGQGF